MSREREIERERERERERMRERGGGGDRQTDYYFATIQCYTAEMT